MTRAIIFIFLLATPSLAQSPVILQLFDAKEPHRMVRVYGDGRVKFSSGIREVVLDSTFQVARDRCRVEVIAKSEALYLSIIADSCTMTGKATLRRKIDGRNLDLTISDTTSN